MLSTNVMLPISRHHHYHHIVLTVIAIRLNNKLGAFWGTYVLCGLPMLRRPLGSYIFAFSAIISSTIL